MWDNLHTDQVALPVDPCHPHKRDWKNRWLSVGFHQPHLSDCSCCATRCLYTVWLCHVSCHNGTKRDEETTNKSKSRSDSIALLSEIMWFSDHFWTKARSWPKPVCTYQRDSMLWWVCSIIDYRWRQHVVGKKDTRGNSHVCNWCSYHMHITEQMHGNTESTFL